MAETAVEQDPIVTGFIAVLETTGFDVGDAQKPADDDGRPYPYSVVYSLPDFSMSGPWSDGQVDVVHQLQVTAVGETGDQARRMQDKNRAAVRGGSMTVAGRKVQLIEKAEGGRGAREDPDQPPLFSAVDIWKIHTTPAAA